MAEDKKEEKKDDKKDKKADAGAPKDPKAKDGKEGEAGEKKKKPLIIIAVAVVALAAIGGGAAFFLLGRGGKKPAEEHATEEHKDEHAKDEHAAEKKDDHAPPKDEHAKDDHGAKKDDHAPATDDHGKPVDPHAPAAAQEGEKPVDANEFGHTFNFKTFHLNLGNPLENHYIRLEVALEYKGGQDQKAEIERRMPQLRDAVVSVASRKSREFLLGPDGKEQLRRELLIRINRYMTKPVESVYITDMLIE